MADDFDATGYGAALAEAIGDEPAMALDAGRTDTSRRSMLETLTVDTAFDGQSLADRGAAECCLAAVWLLHGFLDEAHAICQDVPSSAGSYWHGVMHRREGDYGNAQYWFRRAGDHPAGAVIAAAAASRPETVELARGGRWDAIGFVDLCQQAVRSGGDLADACVALQRAEWRALFDRCHRDATGQ